MAFNIPMKVTSALDKNTIFRPERIQQAYTSANISQAGIVQRVQNVPAASAPPPRQQTASPKPSVKPSAPVIPSMPESSTLLRRGQKFTVMDKSGRIPAHLKLVLDWSVANPQCDLDVSAFLLAENEKVTGEEWFVFYGQPESPDKSVIYSGKTNTGAQLEIHLSQISRQIQKIAVAVTIYEAVQQNLHFGMVQNVTLRMLNQQNQTELARMELNDGTAGVTALVIGEFYRYKGEWKFNAIGSGVTRDLAGFCAMYGIEAG